MPVCSACGADQPKDKYSKAQLGKKDARRCKLCIMATETAGAAGAAAPKASPAAKQKNKTKISFSAAAGGDDDLAILEAAMAENAAAKQEMQLRATEELLQSGTAGIDERNKALAFKQAATRTIIPGQPMPRDLKNALQMALEEIEAEDAAAGQHDDAVIYL